MHGVHRFKSLTKYEHLSLHLSCGWRSASLNALESHYTRRRTRMGDTCRASYYAMFVTYYAIIKIRKEICLMVARAELVTARCCGVLV